MIGADSIYSMAILRGSTRETLVTSQNGLGRRSFVVGDKMSLIYDQDRIKEYVEKIMAKRPNIVRRTAMDYARLILRAEKEGLTTADDVRNRYWGRRYIKSNLICALRL